MPDIFDEVDIFDEIDQEQAFPAPPIIAPKPPPPPPRPMGLVRPDLPTGSPSPFSAPAPMRQRDPMITPADPMRLAPVENLSPVGKREPLVPGLNPAPAGRPPVIPGLAGPPPPTPILDPYDYDPITGGVMGQQDPAGTELVKGAVRGVSSGTMGLVGGLGQLQAAGNRIAADKVAGVLPDAMGPTVRGIGEFGARLASAPTEPFRAVDQAVGQALAPAPDIASFSQDPVAAAEDPRWWASAVGNAVGSIVPSMGTSVIASKGAAVAMERMLLTEAEKAGLLKMVPAFAGALHESATAAGQVFEDAKKKGATDEVALGAASKVAAGTAALAWPMYKLGIFNEKIASAPLRALAGGTAEIVQETGQQATENVVARGSYDPNRDITEGLAESAVGAIGAGSAAGFSQAPGVEPQVDERLRRTPQERAARMADRDSTPATLAPRTDGTSVESMMREMDTKPAPPSYMPKPPSAEESASVFASAPNKVDRIFKENLERRRAEGAITASEQALAQQARRQADAERRKKPGRAEVPEIGADEAVERVRDARDRLAGIYFKQPFEGLDQADQLAVDELVSEGLGFSVQPEEAPAQEPAPAAAPAAAAKPAAKPDIFDQEFEAYEQQRRQEAADMADLDAATMPERRAAKIEDGRIVEAGRPMSFREAQEARRKEQVIAEEPKPQVKPVPLSDILSETENRVRPPWEPPTMETPAAPVAEQPAAPPDMEAPKEAASVPDPPKPSPPVAESVAEPPPAPEMPVKPREIPSTVLASVRRALDQIRDYDRQLKEARIADDKFGGEGRYENEVNDRYDKAPVEKAKKTLETFRGLAVKNGFDPDSVIAEQGGLAEPALSDRARRYKGEATPAASQAPPSLDTPGETIAPPSETKPAINESPVYSVSPSEISTDPIRFQFKLDAIGKGGTTDEFRETRTWNPDLAGVLAVWKDPADGKTYVVNGHHRLELAQRLGAPKIEVRQIEAASAMEARATGALINIAEGRGTSIDAAKFMRDTGRTAADMEAVGISLKGKVAKEGSALAKLSPRIFADVTAGELQPARAAIIGEGLESEADQNAAYDLIANAESRGKTLTNTAIGELIRRVKGAERIVEQNQTLFGIEEMTQNLAVEEAQLSDSIRQRLSREKRLFSTVGNESAAKQLGAAGNQIDAEANRNFAQQVEQALAVYDTLSMRSGPVSDAIREGAKQLAAGQSAKAVNEQAYNAVRDAVTKLIGPSAARKAESGSVGQGDAQRVADDPGGKPAGGERVERTPDGIQETIVTDEEAAASREANRLDKATPLAKPKFGMMAQPEKTPDISDSPLFSGRMIEPDEVPSAPAQDERQNSMFGDGEYMGFGFGALQRLWDRKPAKTPQVRLLDPEVEKRMQAAKITPEKSWFDKLKETAKEYSLVRVIETLPREAKYAPFLFEIKRLEKSKGVATHHAAQAVINTIQKMDQNQYDLFTKKVALDDLVETARIFQEKGKTWDELPFGMKPGSLDGEHRHVTAAAAKDPLITAALRLRKKMAEKVKTDLAAAVTAAGGKDLAKTFQREDYFHHRVLAHLEAKVGSGSGKVQTPSNRGYMQGRQVNALDYSLDYIQSEFEVLQQMMQDTAMAKFVAWVKAPSSKLNIKQDLIAKAKADGFKWKTEEDLVKEYAADTHTAWQPIEGNLYYSAYTIPERAALDAIDEALVPLVLDITPDQIRKKLVLGGKLPSIIIPNDVAATLEKMGNRNETPKGLEAALQATMKLWKQAVLIFPTRVIKYNIRNISGDADRTFVGNPRAFRRVTQAGTELWKYFRTGETTDSLLEWHDRGGMQSLLQVQEIGDINELDQVRHLINPQQPRKGNPASRAWNMMWAKSQKATNFREAILRYANYLEYLEQVKANGKPLNYGASIREEVDAVTDPRDKAFKLSNDLLGAYDEVSVLGQSLRKNLIPFWSFQETNMRAYWRMMQNAARDKQIAGAVGRKMLGTAVSPMTALRVGKFAVSALALKAGLQVWNHLMFPDDERDMDKDRKKKAHIILGRDSDGKAIFFDRLGTLDDILEWTGMDGAEQYMRDYLNDKASLREIALEMAKSPFNKLAGGIAPQFKLVAELGAGYSVYPNITKPRPIRDKGEYASRMLNLNGVYRRVMGLPMPTWTLGDSLGDLMVYKSDPEEVAYWNVKDEVRKWNEAQGRGSFPGNGGGARAEALYYVKQSIRYKDERALRKYLAEFVALGGKKENVKKSLDALNPINGVAKKDRAKFLKSLDADLQRQVALADKFWKTTLVGDKPLALKSAPPPPDNTY